MKKNVIFLCFTLFVLFVLQSCEVPTIPKFSSETKEIYEARFTIFMPEYQDSCIELQYCKKGTEIAVGDTVYQAIVFDKNSFHEIHWELIPRGDTAEQPSHVVKRFKAVVRAITFIAPGNF